MDYKTLEEVNGSLTKIDIKGKEYIQVNERLKAFWKLFPNGRIETIPAIMDLDTGVCAFIVNVYENKDDEYPRATGTALEKQGTSLINKVSWVENCETSALGRALGNAGIGIDVSIASAEEVQNKNDEQTESEKVISGKYVTSLKLAIKNHNIDDAVQNSILGNYGYSKVEDIKMCDYPDIIKDFEKVAGK